MDWTPPPEVDKGAVALLFDDRITVNFNVNGTSKNLLICSNLGPVAKENQLSIYSKMLMEDALAEVDQPIFGIDRQSQSAVLSVSKPIRELDLNKLQNLLEHFLNVADNWLDHLSQDDEDQDSTEKEVPAISSSNAEWMKI